MQFARRCAAVSASLLAVALPALAQGQLWIVDQAAGPGHDFTELQPAIDAAAGGDTILVRAGAYGNGAIDGKALVVAVEPGAVVNVESFAVRNLQAVQEVVIRGIRTNKLTLEDNVGPLWLESIWGGNVVYFPDVCTEFFSGIGLGSWDKLWIRSCADVVIARSSFWGGYSSTVGYDGIHAIDSNLTLFETDAAGGMPGGAGGGSQFDGGDGLDISNCTLVASGCLFLGGCGGNGSIFEAGGDGGAGLRSVGGMSPQLLECQLYGGVPGCGGDPPYFEFCGTPGPASTAPYTLIAGFARDYEIASPGVGGQTTTLAYTGKSGDLVFTLVALSQDSLFLPELAGTLVLPIPPILISHGPASGSGTLGVSVALPPLPPGIEAFPVYAQGAAISGVGAAVLCAPSQLTIL